MALYPHLIKQFNRTFEKKKCPSILVIIIANKVSSVSSIMCMCILENVFVFLSLSLKSS